MAITFNQYNKWRDTLMDFMGRVASAAEKLSLKEKVDFFTQLQERLKNDTFKIQVVGTVKNGKSSFTNALLGEEALPVDDIPCTAVACEVKYGNEKKVLVHFCSPLPTGLLSEIPSETRKYIERYNRGKDANGKDIIIPPLEISYDEMSKYVTIPEPDMDILTNPEKLQEYREKIDQESPYDRAELFCPADILKNGVEVVDSPGLNESPKRTAVTLNYLNESDAVIFLLDASHPATEDEKKCIKDILLPLGFTDLIMVANRIDLVKNRDRQLRYIVSMLGQYTTNKSFFAVSAKNAMDGIKNKDEQKIEDSGIPKFKEFLTDYLAQKKGVVKLRKPAIMMKNIIKDELIGKEIPTCQAHLDTETSELQKRLNEALPILEALNAKRQRIANSLDHQIPLVINSITSLISAYYNDLPNKIDAWVSSFSSSYKVRWGIIPSKTQKEEYAKAITEHIKGEIKSDYEIWNNKTFQPNFQKLSEQAFGSLRQDIADLSTDIAKVENVLQGLTQEQAPDVKVQERILGIAAMLFLPMGRAGADVINGGFDLSRFMKQFAVDLGAGLGIGLIATLVFPPLGIISAIIGALVGLSTGADRMRSRINQQIAAKVKSYLNESSGKQILETVGSVRETFENMKKAILKGIDSEIEKQQAHINEINSIVNGGLVSIKEKRKMLSDVKEELGSVVESIDSFMQDLNQNLHQ